MKKFIVTGTPRSGSTFLCSRLAALDNVYMYEKYDYEPFSPYASVLDEEEYLNSLVENHNDKIVGLKSWWGDSFTLSKHLQLFDPIVIIRKDIKSVFLSTIILNKIGYDENKSSRNRPGSQDISYTDFGLSYTAHNLLKTYFYSEKIHNYHKIYFEDLVSGVADMSPLEIYFENELDLNPKYTGSSLTDYHPDPDKFISILKKTALKMDHKKLPEYVRENLHI